MSFCSQAITGAILFKKKSYAFRLQAGQVTQQYKRHAWSGDTCFSFKFAILQGALSLVPSYVGRFVFFSHLLVSPRLLHLSYTTQVCHWTSVHLHWTSVLLKFLFLSRKFQVSRLRQTHRLEARLWGKCHRHFPIDKKRAAALRLSFLLS